MIWGSPARRSPTRGVTTDPMSDGLVTAVDSLETLVAQLDAVAAGLGEIVTRPDLLQRGVPGGRFDEDPTPTLEWILFHVLQEYARHAGHLDIVRELIDGATGE